MELDHGKGGMVGRLAICAVVAVALIYGVEKVCAGQQFPLWEKYGPWVTENKVQAIAVVAAVLYGASLALFPLEAPREAPPEEPEYTPC